MIEIIRRRCVYFSEFIQRRAQQFAGVGESGVTKLGYSRSNCFNSPYSES